MFIDLKVLTYQKAKKKLGNKTAGKINNKYHEMKY